MCSPIEGCREAEDFPPQLCLGMGSDICTAPGITPWCLRLGPTDEDVVSVWGHLSGVALTLS